MRVIKALQRDVGIKAKIVKKKEKYKNKHSQSKATDRAIQKKDQQQVRKTGKENQSQLVKS